MLDKYIYIARLCYCVDTDESGREETERTQLCSEALVILDVGVTRARRQATQRRGPTVIVAGLAALAGFFEKQSRAGRPSFLIARPAPLEVQWPIPEYAGAGD